MNCRTTAAATALTVTVKQQQQQCRQRAINLIMTKRSTHHHCRHQEMQQQQQQRLQHRKNNNNNNKKKNIIQVTWGQQYFFAASSIHKIGLGNCRFSSMSSNVCCATAPTMTIVDPMTRNDGKGFHYQQQQQQQQQQRNPNHRWTNETTALVVGVGAGIYTTTLFSSSSASASSSPNSEISTRLETLTTFNSATNNSITANRIDDTQIYHHHQRHQERSVPSTMNAFMNTTLSNTTNISKDTLSTMSVTTAAALALELTTNTVTASTNRRRIQHGGVCVQDESALIDKYNIDWNTKLGVGAYGSVHRAQSKDTGEYVALKRIGRHSTSQSRFRTETDVLLRLQTEYRGHPNINRLYDIYEDDDSYYLVMELVAGGELFDHVVEFGAYEEIEAARLMYELSSALSFLHQIGIVHMDLKPENLLLSSKTAIQGSIKLIDFGDACMIQNGTQLCCGVKSQQTSTGTTAYWSPERFDILSSSILGNEHGHLPSAYDMWSIGVILYIMLTGVHPFDIDGCATDDEIEERILTNPKPPLTPDLVGHLSDAAIHLIMETDPQQRMTADEMVQHPWIRRHGDGAGEGETK